MYRTQPFIQEVSKECRKGYKYAQQHQLGDFSLKSPSQGRWSAGGEIGLGGCLQVG
jgi:hypothetical protein